MPDYRRAKVPGGTYFFTVAIAERRRSLLTDHIDDLRHAFRVAHTARPFTVDAIVVLPDHLHCVWTLPPGDIDFPVRWAHIKQVFSRRISWGEPRRASRIAKRERGLWQRRYWEHLIADEDDLKYHVDYIHYNPVKHGHAARVADWPYSSFHRYARSGLYPLDWAGDLEGRASCLPHNA
jgi:putative transposase